MTDLKSKTAGLLDRPLVHVMILIALAVAVYSNTFHVPFLLDDESSIVENPVIHQLSNFFTNMSGYNFHPNRFIGHLSFALNYQFGGLNVVGYHAVNLAIHIANGLLVYVFVRLTLRTPFLVHSSTFKVQGTDPSPFTSHPSLVPFLAGLLFACHPIQTQAVTYIVQRFTSLATLFYLAALVLHIRWRLPHAAGKHFLSRSVFPFWLLSLLSAILAMKTKEIAFTLPLIVLLYEFCFFGKPDRRLLLSLAPLLLTICIIPLGLINLQSTSGTLLANINVATVDSHALPRGEYLLTQFSVIVIYLRLLVLPIGQNLDHDVPVSHSLLEPRAFFSLLLLLTLFGLAVYLFYRSRIVTQGTTLDSSANQPLDNSATQRLYRSPFTFHYSRLFAFGIFWFFITLVVESSLIPLRDVIFEHRLYLQSVGFFIAMATLTTLGLSTWKFRIPAAGKLAVPLLAGVVLFLAAGAYARNQVWHSWHSIWQDAKEKSPRKARPYNNIGVYYGRQGQHPEAIREFEMAVRLDPTFIEAIDNLGQAYMWTGRYRDAEALSMMVRSTAPETYNLLQSYQRLARSKNPSVKALQRSKTNDPF